MRRTQENVKGSTNRTYLEKKNKEVRKLEKFLEIIDSRNNNLVQGNI